MKLYNSINNKIEDFKSINEKEVNMYVCGPTVYNYPHIGNARPIVVFDTLRRLFSELGYDVKFVSNYTDVDDKIINKAIEEGVSELEIANRFIDYYNADRTALNALMPSVAPRVTETMDKIIDFIEQLVEKGYAYNVDGDVYFRVNKLADYGMLSNQNIEDLQVGARINSNTAKENPLDFTLWKKTEVGVNWNSPWSAGRPGWHSECVVMIEDEFNEQMIDIHGGGMDLKFPHHENEIAQSEALYGHRIAKYWMHNGMINIDGTKMSKSLGNVWWVKDMIATFGGNVTRWLLISSHYRAPLNLNEETILSIKKEYEKTANTLKQAQLKLALNEKREAAVRGEIYQEFMNAMVDDLNTPNALSAIFEMNKQVNQLVRVIEIDYDRLAGAVGDLRLMLDILGIVTNDFELSGEARALYFNWDEAKKAKDFEKADEYRQQLIELGVI